MEDQVDRDLRADQERSKKKNSAPAPRKMDRDKRDFKDTHNVKKGGGGSHNWGKPGDELNE